MNSKKKNELLLYLELSLTDHHFNNHPIYSKSQLSQRSYILLCIYAMEIYANVGRFMQLHTFTFHTSFNFNMILSIL